MNRHSITHRNYPEQLLNASAIGKNQFGSTNGQACIMIVDNDEKLREILCASLENAGYSVVLAANGEEALKLFSLQAVHLVLMELLLPGEDGFETCKALREISDVPIVILSALNRTNDVVRSFELGADDFISKPFAFYELETRIMALLRRVGWSYTTQRFSIVTGGDVTINDDERRVIVRGKHVHLTPTEYQILYHLMAKADCPVSKLELCQRVWGHDLIGGRNMIEVAVRRLREKVELNASNPVYIMTVRGIGYKFDTSHAQDDPAAAHAERQMLPTR